MLTALLLERILRHKVVDPFPEEGTYHDRWYRDRRRRRVNAQWRRRLLSPTRDRGRQPWCPELPDLVVTDEDGREYRDSFPPVRPLGREREMLEDGRDEDSLRDKHVLQVPGKRDRKSHSERSPATTRHSALSSNKEGRSHLNVSYIDKQSRRFDRHYEDKESLTSVGQGERADRRENTGRENCHDDGYRLHTTPINVTSKQSTVSPRKERETYLETSSSKQQRQQFWGRYVGKEFVTSEGHRHRTGEREILARENTHDDGYRLRHTSVNTTSRQSSSLITEEKQEQRSDRRCAEEEPVRSVGQPDKADKRENNNDDEYRLRHTSITTAARHDTESFSKESKSYTKVSSYGREEQRLERNYLQEEHSISGGQGDKDGGRQSVGRENKYGDEYRLRHSTSKHSTVSLREEQKSHLEQSVYERHEQHFERSHVKEEFVPSNAQGGYSVKQPESVQNSDYGDKCRLVHTISGQSTTSLTEEHRPKQEQSFHERQEQRLDRHHVKEELVSSNGRGDNTVKDPENTSQNNYGDTTFKNRTMSRYEEQKSYQKASFYERKEGMEDKSVPSSGRGDYIIKKHESEQNNEYSLVHTTSKPNTASQNEEHSSNSDESFCERHGCPFGHFVSTDQHDTAEDREIHNYGDGYHLRHKAIRALAEEIKELLAEIRTSRVETTYVERQGRRSDKYYLQEDIVSSVSHRGRAEQRENNDADQYHLHNTPIYGKNIEDGLELYDDVSPGKHLTQEEDVSEDGGTEEEGVVYEDLLLAQGNQRRETSHRSSVTSKYSKVSVIEERKTYLETSLNERQGQTHHDNEQFVPSRSQGHKDGGQENSHGDEYGRRHTPISTVSEKTTVSSTEEHKTYTEESSSGREHYQLDRHYVREEGEEEECWHSKCQHGRAVDWETLARENKKNDNKSRLRRVPIKVALREVYTDKWRQYMNVCQESDVGKADSDEEPTHTRRKDHETYVSQRTIKLRNASDDAWREQHPEGNNGEASTEGDGVGDYKVAGHDDYPRYRSVFEDNDVEDEDTWQETEDARHRSVFEDNVGEDEETLQARSNDFSLSYTSQRRREEVTEDSRHRSVFEDHGEDEEERNSFFQEWSSLRYTGVSAADFAEWSWLLTSDPRAREDVSEDGESADYLARRHQRLMDIVDGFDEEQLSRLEWFLRQVCLLEEDFNHSLDRRSFDFSEFRADLEFVARTYFDIELRDLELHSTDSRHDYLSDEDTDLETIPESDHEYDADDDGYEMSPSPAPLTSSRVDLHNISTTKGLKRWDSRDSAIGSSIGGTLRSWGSQSTVDGTSETSGYRLSLDSDVFYFGDMSKYGRRSFGSTPYLSRESYC